MKTRHDTDAVIDALVAEVRGKTQKVSAAPRATPVPRETKVSNLKARNADLRRMAMALGHVADVGIAKFSQQLEMDSVTSPEMQVPDGRTSLPPGSAADAILRDSVAYTGDSPDIIQPATTNSGPTPIDLGGTNPALASTEQGGVVPTVLPGEDDVKVTEYIDAMEPSIKSSASQADFLRKVSAHSPLGPGFTSVAQLADYAAETMSIRSTADAYHVLKRSAAHARVSLGAYVATLGLASGQKKYSARLLREQAPSFTGEELHRVMPTYARYQKFSSSEIVNEVDIARDFVEGVVKAKAELPTATEVAQAAGVSPTSAGVAIYETGELIAAVGGQVSAPGQGAPAVPPPMGMAPPAGGPPPAMAGMPPAGGMAPPPPPPVDPAMMGGAGGMPPGAAPPMDPSMMPPPPMDPAMQVTSGVHPQRLAELISRMSGTFERMSVRSGDLSFLSQEEPENLTQGGVPTNTPGTGDIDVELVATEVMSAEERALLDGLGSASTMAGIEDRALDASGREPNHVVSNLSPPSATPWLTAPADRVNVSGTMHGDLTTGVAGDAKHQPGPGVKDPASAAKTSSAFLEQLASQLYGASKVSASEEDPDDEDDEDEEEGKEDDKDEKPWEGRDKQSGNAWRGLRA